MKKPIDTTATLHHQIATLILVKKSGPRKLPGRPVEPRARYLSTMVSRKEHVPASIRVYRTVPTVEGGAATLRSYVGSRNQTRRLPTDGRPP